MRSSGWKGCVVLVSSSERRYWEARLSEASEDERTGVWFEMASLLGSKGASEVWMAYFSAAGGSTDS